MPINQYKWVILVPYGAETGGPEAQHQLARSLIDAGQNAGIYYYTDAELKKFYELFPAQARPGASIKVSPRVNPVNLYDKYRVPSLHDICLNHYTVLVLGEPLLGLIPRLVRTGVHFVTTWLSFDFSFRALQGLNLQYLRLRSVINTAQSTYASQVLRAIGVPSPLMVTDYTVTDDIPGVEGLRAGVSEKEDLILLGAHPKKTIFDVDQVLESWKLNFEIRVCLGLDRAEISSLMRRAKIFVELGNSPGKDRMPREALVNKCVVYCVRGGASLDYNLPSAYYFDIEAVGKLGDSLNKSMLLYNDEYPKFFKSLESVDQEKVNFDVYVRELIEQAYRRFDWIDEHSSQFSRLLRY